MLHPGLQMISGLRGLQEVLLLAKLTNRTLLAPLTGSHYAKSFFHMPPTLDDDAMVPYTRPLDLNLHLALLQ